MEDLILQEVHRHTVSFLEVLDTTPATALSMHQLRRPLRNLDRSLGRLEDFLKEPPSLQQKKQTETQTQTQVSDNQSTGDRSIVLGNMRQQQHSQPSQQSDLSGLLPLEPNHQQQQSYDNEAYDQTRQVLWTILIRLPVWPTEDVCVSILRRTVLIWEHVLVDSVDIPAALESLLERIVQTPDCLFSVYGLAWVRMANQLRVTCSGVTMMVVSQPALAYYTMQFLLPTLRGELKTLVDTSTPSDASGSRFVQGLVQLLGWVTQELVARSIHEQQQQQQQQQPQTLFSLENWLVSLAVTNHGDSQQQQERQQVTEFLHQIMDYTTLLVDYAQDELDQACSCQSSTHNTESIGLLQSAIDLILEAYVFCENLQAWQSPEDSAGNMRALWQTLAQANVVSTLDNPAYEEHYLPALVRLTQSILASHHANVDLATFIGVFLRLVPYAHLWIEAVEIWSHLESHTPTLRRLIQLVLLTCSSPTCPAEAQMCARLQELLSAANDGNTSMADLYFAGNHTPVVMGPE